MGWIFTDFPSNGVQSRKLGLQSPAASAMDVGRLPSSRPLGIVVWSPQGRRPGVSPTLVNRLVIPG